MAMPNPEQAKAWGGKTIVDRTGATIGACTQVYNDDATGLPEWATARMGNISVLLPLVDAIEDDDQVRVTVGRDAVLLAPVVADPLHISQTEEARLYRHYGIAFSQDGSRSQLPVGEGTPRSPRTMLPGSMLSPGSMLRDGASDKKVVLLVLAVTAGVFAGVLSVLSRRRRPEAESRRDRGR